MTVLASPGKSVPVRRAARTACAGALAAAVLCWPPGAAYADATSAYGDWSVSGATGTVAIPLADFPSAAVATDSSTAVVEPGTSVFLGPGTPVGDRYGTSQGKEYVTLRTAAGRTPSTTTLTFEHPTNAGTFAFTLGDIDADSVRVTATGADGQPLTVDQLGWQGAFNYCQATPKPSECGAAGTDTDVPNWDPATSTLTGNGSDTTGASGWFQPTVPVTGITLTFTRQSGFPVYQVWTSSLSSRIAGQVTADCGTPAGLEVRLLDENGQPVLGTDGAPLTTTTDDQGRYSFTDLAPGPYQVSTESDDYTPPTSSRTADTSDGNSVTDADLALTCRVVPAPSPTVSIPPVPEVPELPLPTVSIPPVPEVPELPSPIVSIPPVPEVPELPSPIVTIPPVFPIPPAPTSPSPTPTCPPTPPPTHAPKPTAHPHPHGKPKPTAHPHPHGNW
ncbi:carboxypeptidase regulatory-like domain-containing protein [Streptomyces sp. NPDC058195]|uniref:carboxypeptidase regulatory-like domain-containing protein n=1 Tax=Streptomyces sp. NPDC058195 TaxID=3346375 RepID=UPI0036E989F0